MNAELIYAATRLLGDIEAIGEQRWCNLTRMNSAQTIEFVINRRGSIGLSGVPHWSWCEILENGDFCVATGYHSLGLWRTRPDGSKIAVRFNPFFDALEGEDAAVALLDAKEATYGVSHLPDAMIRHGLQIERPFLVRACTWVGGDTESYEAGVMFSEVIYAPPIEGGSEPFQAMLDAYIWDAAEARNLRENLAFEAHISRRGRA